MLIGLAHFVSGKASDVERVLALLKTEGVEVRGNPDVYIRHVGNFGIDEARELSAKAAMRPIAGERRYFIISVDAITPEAQNALLKTLEEPPAGAVFIFIHPAPETLLATVRSRAQIMRMDAIHQGDALMDVQAFLKATPSKRLEMLKPMLEKGDDDKRDFGAILAFLTDLERELGKPSKKNEKGAERLHTVYRARRYIGDRGALVKPLMEQVALLV